MNSIENSNPEKTKPSAWVEDKIEETYNLALRLGLNSAKYYEKEIFKKMLYEIAVRVTDEVRRDFGKLTHELSDKYTHQSRSNE
jgi:hypothetical protein